MKKFLLFISLILGISSGYSQITFKARVSQRNITTDDRVRISFIAQGNSRNIYNGRLEAPSFEGFQAMGPFVSQDFLYINGSSFYKKSYTFTLKPEKAGDFTIEPAVFVLEDKEYKTRPIRIHVAKGEKPLAPPIVSQGTKQNPAESQNGTKDIFLVAQVTKNKPYINEAVGLTYKLYIPKSYGVQNYRELSQPQYKGFWAQDIDRNISGPFQGEINGKAYEYYILKKKLLFPQEKGKLTINPLTLSIDIQVPVIRQMGYFQIRDFENKRIKLSSGPKTLYVRPLPEEGKPLDFSGAVGQFDFFVNPDRNKVPSGEAVNIEVGVKGTGNLKLFNLPELKAPEGIEVYDPTHTEDVRPTFAGNKGTVTDKYILIPNHSGKYIIPSMRFTYFNPQTNSYETKTTEDIILFATGNNAYQSTSNLPANTGGGKDFRYIKEKQHLIEKSHKTFFKSRIFYILLGIPFLLALLFYLYKKIISNRIIDESKIQLNKRKSLAQAYLKEAASHTQNKDLFYSSLEKAIHNFLKAKLQIDTSELTKENIRKLLNEKKVDNKDIETVISILNNCEMARYTPFGAGDIRHDLSQTEKVINSINKQI